MSDHFADTKSQKNKNASKRIKNSGNRKASREMNHHLSGWRKALQQASRNRRAITQFSRREKRLVNFCNDAMGGF
jgi:hypothetical protein